MALFASLLPGWYPESKLLPVTKSDRILKPILVSGFVSQNVCVVEESKEMVRCRHFHLLWLMQYPSCSADSLNSWFKSILPNQGGVDEISMQKGKTFMVYIHTHYISGPQRLDWKLKCIVKSVEVKIIVTLYRASLVYLILIYLSFRRKIIFDLASSNCKTVGRNMVSSCLFVVGSQTVSEFYDTADASMTR